MPDMTTDHARRTDLVSVLTGDRCGRRYEAEIIDVDNLNGEVRLRVVRRFTWLAPPPNAVVTVSTAEFIPQPVRRDDYGDPREDAPALDAPWWEDR